MLLLAALAGFKRAMADSASAGNGQSRSAVSPRLIGPGADQQACDLGWVAQIPRDKRGIAFGMILDPLDDADRAYMMRSLPAPVQMLSPFLIERPWKKYAATLRNGT
jgi:hypothetical protein